MAKYEAFGLKHPGRINARLNGRFQELRIYELSETQLEQLYNDGCPYVRKTAETVAPEAKKIEVKELGKKYKRKGD